MDSAGKFWNFYDDWGLCVHSIGHSEGDTHTGVSEWWHDFIKGEEYNPYVTAVVLEDFRGDDN